jgi:anti-sigma B factor antagonist
MQITTRDAGEVVILTLHGRLVLEEVEAELREKFDDVIEHGQVKVVVNLHDVAYVDSAGLGFLVSKYVSLHRRGGDIKLVQVTPRVAHVLDITRLNRVFPSFASDDEAVRAFQAPAGRELTH